jgi:hypothetical protein
LVRFGFGFISLKPKKPNRTQIEKKTEPNWKKPSQTGTGRFELVFVLKNRTEPKSIGLSRFWFFLKKINLVILKKIKLNPK